MRVLLVAGGELPLGHSSEGDVGEKGKKEKRWDSQLSTVLNHCTTVNLDFLAVEDQSHRTAWKYGL